MARRKAQGPLPSAVLGWSQPPRGQGGPQQVCPQAVFCPQITLLPPGTPLAAQKVLHGSSIKRYLPPTGFSAASCSRTRRDA